MFFLGEKLNLTEISAVANYCPKRRPIHKYLGKLPTYELMYFHMGNVWLKFGDKSFFVKTGDMVYLPKGIENKTYHIIPEHEFGVYNFYFDTLDPLPNEAVHIPIESAKIKSIYETAFKVWTGKSSSYYFKTMQLFFEVLETLIKYETKYLKPKNDRSFLLVEDYISKHFCDKDFDYKALSEISGFSYSYFKKVFIAKHGIPPVKYITKLKVDYACELLKTGKYKIFEIADICGYENTYYFSNVFKKHTNVSPKNYR